MILAGNEAQHLLEKLGAVVTNGHFVYPSGRHGSAYISEDALYPQAHDVARLCETLAEHFVKFRISTVVAPAPEGSIIAQWVSYYLTERTGLQVYGVCAEQPPSGPFAFKKDYERHVKDHTVLVVDDVLKTGMSVLSVVAAVRLLSGTVAGVGAICNRGTVTTQTVGGVPELHSLLNLKGEVWSEADCPLCRDSIPVNPHFGNGAAFLARRKVSPPLM